MLEDSAATSACRASNLLLTAMVYWSSSEAETDGGNDDQSSGDTPFSGHNIIFCAQSQTTIQISRGTGSFIVVSQGLSHPFLKTFAALFHDLNDRPWVSEDECHWDCFDIVSFFVKNILNMFQFHALPTGTDSTRAILSGNKSGYFCFATVEPVSLFITNLKFSF